MALNIKRGRLMSRLHHFFTNLVPFYLDFPEKFCHFFIWDSSTEMFELSTLNRVYFLQLSRKYGNISIKIIKGYISIWTTCSLKTVQMKKSRLKLIISSRFMDRMQVSLRLTQNYYFFFCFALFCFRTESWKIKHSKWNFMTVTTL